VTNFSGGLCVEYGPANRTTVDRCNLPDGLLSAPWSRELPLLQLIPDTPKKKARERGPRNAGSGRGAPTTASGKHAVVVGADVAILGLGQEDRPDDQRHD
jgi:hypothetical protein